MGRMQTGPKANPAKGKVVFGKNMKADNSNMVPGKSSKAMGVKKGSKKTY